MPQETPGNPFSSPERSGPRRGNGLGFLGPDLEVLEIKRGGMGEVYICKVRKQPGQLLALKTFQKKFLFDRHIRIAFLREVAVWMRLSGLPHILPALRLEFLNGRPFVVMPAAAGHIITVRDGLNYRSPFPPRMAHDIAFQVARGMQFARQQVPGMAHGDLKPENLIVGSDRGISITDFGLATVPGVRSPSALLDSSWPYQAPECWTLNVADPYSAGRRSVASDIYALGVVLYEMLTGRPPFVENGRERWQWAHAHAVPNTRVAAAATPLGRSLINLTARCLSKNPAERPADFDEIAAELYDMRDSFEALDLWFLTAEMQHRFETLQREIKPQLVRALILVDELELATAELNAFPEQWRDAKYWELRGSVLSMSRRDAEALPCFECALEQMPDPDQRRKCQCELGLTLKRLGRFEEATDLYHRLLLEVPDKMLEYVVGNLATVHLDQRHSEDAIHVLLPFTRRVPNNANAWANLGMAYLLQKRFQEAADCLWRALSIDPGLTQVRVRLANNVLAEGLGRVEEASALLENAFERGDDSRQLFVGALACALAMRDETRIAELDAGIRITMPADIAQGVVQSAVEMTLRIVAAARNPPADTVHKTPPIPPEKIEAGLGDLQAAVGQLAGSAGRRIPGLPAGTWRIHPKLRLYTTNFYDDLESNDYVETFARFWLATQRTFCYRLGDVMPRSNPFYFTECPHCKFLILTNRDRLEDLTCRRCSGGHKVKPVRRAEVRALAARIHTAIGKRLINLHGKTIVLILQPKDERKSAEIAAICGRHDFHRQSRESYDLMPTIVAGYDGGVLDRRMPFEIWAKRCRLGATGYLEDTPPAAQCLILELRGHIENLSSLSTVVESSCFDYEAHFHELVRRNPQDVTSHYALTEILIRQERFEEARVHALAAVRLSPQDAISWSTLAYVESRIGQWKESIEHSGRALALDPSDQRAWMVQVRSHRALGNTEEEQRALSRLRTLGDWPTSRRDWAGLPS